VTCVSPKGNPLKEFSAGAGLNFHQERSQQGEEKKIRKRSIVLTALKLLPEVQRA